MAASALVACLLFLTFSVTDGYLLHVEHVCVFNSSDPNDIEYLLIYNYNKLKLFSFSSTLDMFVGYTEFGIKQATYFNNDKDYIANVRAEKERVCFHNIKLDYESALTKSAKPYVRLHSESPPEGSHSAMLVCIVYDFYPKQIRVTWLRDGQEATGEVTSTDEMPDGDWYYQVHSHLVYTPKSGEKITCVVEHASLDKPLHVDWDTSLPKSEKNKLAIGGAGLTLGVVLSLGGFLYYRKQCRGRILVPTD
ncbi:HLA class II histocompatibility antigen, DQ beta 1 chain-like [Hippocampus comes]|uniref:HLA class II histocompatibility antigen, DQ beta 1 chain-like n=1 Tax=Hippocampus comes TaxID=109280 RepID=A0A3Q2Y365_HIPCM|nr:PREDICTED: HLA class II histocompatibility antigen, DQ beta 1 chain-like [Hippocampus comes]